uniref:Uncharacterized protein n=1 Tax=Arundo donax TaxID=35708 RepID=A0A0A9ADD5_ARUDO
MASLVTFTLATEATRSVLALRSKVVDRETIEAPTNQINRQWACTVAHRAQLRRRNLTAEATLSC